MLSQDDVGWFVSDSARIAALVGAFREAVGELRTTLGDRPHHWQWGAIHHKGLHHPLSSIGDLGLLLDQPARPSGGDIAVLNNVGFGGGRVPAGDRRYATNWEGTSGAGYRMVADLGDPHGSAWTVTLEGQSANTGSPHRSDQLEGFLAGHHHEISLDRARTEHVAAHRLIVQPRGRHD
jgi:acyl-homoserine lactone acylase PvdQ